MAQNDGPAEICVAGGARAFGKKVKESYSTRAAGMPPGSVSAESRRRFGLRIGDHNLLARSKRDIIQSEGCNEFVERGDGFGRYF